MKEIIHFQKRKTDILKKIHRSRPYFVLLKLIKLIRKLAEDFHRKKKDTYVYLDSILHSSLNNIYWIDKKGKIIGCNDQQAKMMGLENRNELIGKNVIDIGCRHNDIVVMQTGQSLLLEETCLIENKIHYFLSSKSPMLNAAGEIIGVLGISTDITEQKNLTRELEHAREKAETANRIKSEFVANISHDIRTPLVGIQGIVNILKAKLPAEFQNEITAIANASHELLSLLNSVIDISKIESENTEEQAPKDFNLMHIIVNLMNLVTPLVQQKNLSLKIRYPEDLPQTFKGQPFLVQRVLLNIISNAIKFTLQGSIEIQVERSTTVLDDAKIFPLLLTVKDTGIGMSTADSEKIFESFFRVNPSFQGQFRGSGLGLSIAKKFIEKMKGSVWVKSELGEGSQFFIFLPLELSSNSNSHFLSSGDENDINDEIKEHIHCLGMDIPPLPFHTSSCQFNRRILLVEDNVLIQKAVAALLSKLNNNVDIAPNGKTALALAQQAIYDLIFMDIGLPDIDGFTISRQIREFNAEIPIIALTAHLDQECRSICRESGINEIITKPLTLKRAQTCLNQYSKCVSLC